MLGEGAVHLDELLADGGVDGDLLAEHLHLLVGHHLDVPPEPFPTSGPLVRCRGSLGPVPPLHHPQPLQDPRSGKDLGRRATGRELGKPRAICAVEWSYARKEIGRLGRHPVGGDAGVHATRTKVPPA